MKSRRCSSGLYVLLVLAAATLSNPLKAHVGVSEEIEAVTERIQDSPDAVELYLLRGDLHRIYEHWSEALEDYKTAARLDPGNAATDLGLGRTNYDRGLFAEAIDFLDQAISKQPCNVRGLVTRATSFRMSGNPLAAADDYDRAINCFEEPHKPLPDYYFERARALESAGPDHIEVAIQTLDSGIDRLGKVWILEDYAADLEHRRGNYVGALLRLDRLFDQSARKEALLLRRSKILLEAGRIDEASADLAEARDAVDLLPPQRRRTPVMRQLMSDIEDQSNFLQETDSNNSE